MGNGQWTMDNGNLDKLDKLDNNMIKGRDLLQAIGRIIDFE